MNEHDKELPSTYLWRCTETTAKVKKVIALMTFTPLESCCGYFARDLGADAHRPTINTAQ